MGLEVGLLVVVTAALARAPRLVSPKVTIEIARVRAKRYTTEEAEWPKKSDQAEDQCPCVCKQEKEKKGGLVVVEKSHNAQPFR